jgi:hypothetical protein
MFVVSFNKNIFYTKLVLADLVEWLEVINDFQSHLIISKILLKLIIVIVSYFISIIL